MASLFASAAYRLRWMRRAVLCRWRNRFPRAQQESVREVIDLHRRQKADFATLQGPAGLAGRADADRAEREARLALFPERIGYGNCLEIGCENGWFGRLLVDRGVARRVVGVDLRAEEMRGHARPGAGLLAASAEHLPLKARFDLVAAFHVIEHIRDPEALRAELARVARPGSHVALAVPLGWDEDPCHRGHFMTEAGWRRFLWRRFGLEFMRGGVHRGLEDAFIGLFRLV